ncbi:MAG: phosphotransferase [Pyrinomonadaceae bacterium]
MKTEILKDWNLNTAEIFCRTFQDAKLLKYRPGKRGLFRVKIEKTDYFVKIYPKKFLRQNRGENIHLVGKKLWDAANEGKFGFRVPTPVFWDGKTRTLWQKKLEGRPAIEFLKGKTQKDLIFQIGRSVAQINDSGIPAQNIFDWKAQFQDSLEFASMLSGNFPVLKHRVAKLLEYLARLRPVQILVPTHGDMHVDQWLFDGISLGLLDFEDFSLAAGERDLAFFIVQAEAQYSNLIDVKKLERILLEGFSAAGKRADRGLLQIYKAHKWLAKAARAESADRAQVMLEKAFEGLEGR